MKAIVNGWLVLEDGLLRDKALLYDEKIIGIGEPEAASQAEEVLDARGAYVCPDPACLKKAIKSRALERALSVSIPDAIYAQLEARMEAGDG